MVVEFADRRLTTLDKFQEGFVGFSSASVLRVLNNLLFALTLDARLILALRKPALLALRWFKRRLSLALNQARNPESLVSSTLSMSKNDWVNMSKNDWVNVELLQYFH